MDKKELEQYPFLLAKIKELDRQIEDLSKHPVAADTVMGSLDEHPYILHPISIAGLPNTEQIRSLHQEWADYHERANRIEDFMNHLPNLKIRRIVEMKAVRNMEWKDIANEITRITGRDTTESSVKHIYARALKRKK